MTFIEPEVTPNQGNTFNSAPITPPLVSASSTGTQITGASSLQLPVGSEFASSTLGKIATLSDGWYVFLACLTGVITAGTKAGPYATGVLGLALIYQLGLYLQDK